MMILTIHFRYVFSRECGHIFTKKDQSNSGFAGLPCHKKYFATENWGFTRQKAVSFDGFGL
jgi:hypothetical protein